MNVLKVYNLRNPNGDALTLRLGYDTKLRESTGDKDAGLRWSFEGKHIPMPVRANTWFNGFPEPVMLNWLKGAGWALRCVVDMPSGKATIYNLPFESERAYAEGNYLTHGFINNLTLLLCNEGHKDMAKELQRRAYRLNFPNAGLAVEQIVKAAAKETDWIPVSSGRYPKDKEAVQITYLRHPDNKPLCDAVAFRYDGNWRWGDNGTPVAVKVTAWRPCNAYKATEITEEV